jgi:hypothetical protein
MEMELLLLQMGASCVAQSTCNIGAIRFFSLGNKASKSWNGSPWYYMISLIKRLSSKGRYLL